MNLDQLQTQWQQLDERVTKLETSRSHRRSLLGLYGSPISDILFGLLITSFAGEYLFRQAELLKSTPMAAIPMLLILATGILLCATAGRQLLLLNGYGLGQSPLENWQVLTAVRTIRVKTFCVLVGTWTPLWFLMPVAVLQSLGAHQILEKLHAGWMLGNVIVGIAAYALAAWAAKKWIPAAAITQLLTGTALNRAIEETKAVKRFATDLS